MSASWIRNFYRMNTYSKIEIRFSWCISTNKIALMKVAQERQSPWSSQFLNQYQQTKYTIKVFGELVYKCEWCSRTFFLLVFSLKWTCVDLFIREEYSCWKRGMLVVAYRFEICFNLRWFWSQTRILERLNIISAFSKLKIHCI